MESINERSKIVLKTDHGYLQDAYESYDAEEENFDFTYDIDRAYNFFDSVDVPKYMWNNVEQKEIYTVAELCEFLNGTLVKITTKTLIEHHEEEYSIDDLRVGIQFRR